MILENYSHLYCNILEYNILGDCMNYFLFMDNRKRSRLFQYDPFIHKSVNETIMFLKVASVFCKNMGESEFILPYTNNNK